MDIQLSVLGVISWLVFLNCLVAVAVPLSHVQCDLGCHASQVIICLYYIALACCAGSTRHTERNRDKNLFSKCLVHPCRNNIDLHKAAEMTCIYDWHSIYYSNGRSTLFRLCK
ncbi:uncharacterized protein BO88DRAFT_213687 [Aspergillus vadensis CBS 113365]|uniref:Uncharacterized protein n=1 Tax=Aspergillus vadensis (strain CBS 113365 / IMI 142717 / IBT 24658) TaxID=1448311 RepID=A0A319BGT3_ASPVC|nr:hypothetical protein BO88DRAFT_213687 [Aspergillus vadensis CBS 113365]PYH72406.1 hypothetical protein BO88DRAFT_213687 [Aspergillus vadensis CBS 113365]